MSLSTIFVVTLLFSGALASPSSEDIAEDSGSVPPAAAGGMAAPRNRLLEDANLGGLGHVAILAGVEANQAAGYFTSYVITILSEINPDTILRSPCFIQEREGDDHSQESSTNFLERLAEDYTGALGYSSYLQLITDHFCQDPTRSISYCAYLGDAQRTVSTMTQSLANLVRFINESAYQGAVAAATTSLQSPDHKSTGDKATTSLPTHCSDPCYEQQASVLGRLLTLAGKYIRTDVEGYMARGDAS